VEQDLIELVREWYKEAASKRTMRIANSRVGRRPMSVDTLLRKEKDGTLYKRTEIIKQGAKGSDVVLPGSLSAPFAKDKMVTRDKAPVDKETNRLETNADSVADEHTSYTSELEKSGLALGEDKPVTYREATEALRELAKLKRQKLTKEDVMQSAASGAITSGIATPLAGLVSGSVPGAFREGYGAAPRKGVPGKIRGVGAGAHKVMRGLAGAATGSAIFGAMLPLVQKEVKERAREQKLKEYAGLRPGTSLRGKIRKATGV